VAGRLGFDLFKQQIAKCFTSILAVVDHTIVLSDIASNLHGHCHRHNCLQAYGLTHNHELFSI
jgi:hypothetical protein